MALFGKKKAEDTAEVAPASKKESKPKAATKPTVNNATASDRNLSSVLVKPHITEKAVGASERNVYTFVVRQSATKYDVRDAVQAAFGVTPVKVNIVKKSSRTIESRMRGKKVKQSGMKKAYVYLKDGDSISLV